MFSSILRLTKPTRPALDDPSRLEAVLRNVVIELDPDHPDGADQSGQLAWAMKVIEALHTAGYLTLTSPLEVLKSEFSTLCRGRASDSIMAAEPELLVSRYSQ